MAKPAHLVLHRRERWKRQRTELGNGNGKSESARQSRLEQRFLEGRRRGDRRRISVKGRQQQRERSDRDADKYRPAIVCGLESGRGYSKSVITICMWRFQ